MSFRQNVYVSEEIIDYFWLKRHWNYFKYNALLHMLNGYKIPRKEHQVVDFWVTDEKAASEVLFWIYSAYVSA